MTNLSRAAVSSREKFCWVRRIRPPQLQTPALRTSDRRQARADFVQDRGHVDADGLQNCDRDDRNQSQNQRVLDERLTFITHDSFPCIKQSQIRLVQNSNHLLPLSDQSRLLVMELVLFEHLGRVVAQKAMTAALPVEFPRP